jgi:hypothetical protein
MMSGPELISYQTVHSKDLRHVFKEGHSTPNLSLRTTIICMCHKSTKDVKWIQITHIINPEMG